MDVTLLETVLRERGKDQFSLCSRTNCETRFHPLSPCRRAGSERSADSNRSEAGSGGDPSQVELEARLIDDLLDVTRIAKGKLQLSRETVGVHEILQRSYEICREEIAAKFSKSNFGSGPNTLTSKATSPIAAGVLESD